MQKGKGSAPMKGYMGDYKSGSKGSMSGDKGSRMTSYKGGGSGRMSRPDDMPKKPVTSETPS